MEGGLERWDIAEGLRELIANALDEEALTGTAEPEIAEMETGKWRIRDSGRGIRYEHFTQKEDPEKLRKRHLVIGKFGFGLKDAIAALDRRGARIHMSSRHAEIGIERLPKHGFDDIRTVLGKRSEEHTSELQSHLNLVCRLLLEKKKKS